MRLYPPHYLHQLKAVACEGVWRCLLFAAFCRLIFDLHFLDLGFFDLVITACFEFSIGSLLRWRRALFFLAIEDFYFPLLGLIAREEWFDNKRFRVDFTRRSAALTLAWRRFGALFLLFLLWLLLGLLLFLFR